MDDRKTPAEIAKEAPKAMKLLVEILQGYKAAGIDVKPPDPEILAKYGLVWEE